MSIENNENQPKVNLKSERSQNQDIKQLSFNRAIKT